ncbi:phage tail family protein [Latilactobacillus curvatus]|uniref:phage tail domain-containing protein n=1 Tax=Latilactobacillus curvatus TaxID=28038 RepID=UPI0011BB34E2|nr:phage tail domain-containing protein [Latilactobacillus curvatus]QEA49911.1 phage tail family protein [Latilactobacillus curvatus]
MEPKFYIKRGDTPEFEITDAIQGLEFLGNDSSPVIANTYQQNAGRDGQLFQTQTFDKTVENANFLINFGDWYDFKLLKHDIYRIFSQRSMMRIRTDAEMGIVKYVRPTSFDIKPISDGAHDATFTIPFENPSGYKYSLARSDNLYDYDSELWQIGMNLPNGQDIGYHFTQLNFDVYNASDIPIDPYYQKHDLRIICHFNGSNLTILNKTNGSSWQYQKAASKSDTIILDGIKTTLNGDPASVNTDYGNIVLETGYNNISVTGATDIDITFSFPFIYLG